METGKTSRYFKYAIGDIILVVIGILIAENLTPSLPRAARSFSGGAKGGFSNIVYLSVVTPLGEGGEGKGNNWFL